MELTGQRFGKLLVTSFSHTGNGYKKYWNCDCDCGNTAVVSQTHLRSGKTGSCGCLRSKSFNDLVGQRFGRLLVKALAYKRNKQSFWDCDCDCGNKHIVGRTALISGATQSCGCLHREISRERAVDLTGQQFGRLSVIYHVFSTLEGEKYYLCKCECGNEKFILGSSLRAGRTTSCGCYNKEILRSKFKDITGERFGRLVVQGRSFINGEWARKWECKCDCGNECIVEGEFLRNGTTKSCGCYLKDRSLLPLSFYSDSEAYKKTKNIYHGMKRRCLSKNAAVYKHYGDRGIKVCDRWLESFENFYEDMGTCPSHHHQIDRIDNDGNYCLENCRWATSTENMGHTRASTMIEYNGEIKCVTALAREYGINVNTLRNRISKWGDVEKSLLTPVKGRIKK